MYNRGRRASLPVQSLTNGDETRLFGRQKKKKKKKKVPCCETLPYDLGNREEDTPDDLKNFIKEIEAEDSDDSLPRGLEDLPFNERVRLRNKALFGSNTSIHKIHKSSSKPVSRRSSFADTSIEIMTEEIINEDEYQEYLAKEKKVTKFTEMEIVALWNQFKLNFPHGTVSKPQLTGLLQQVI